MGTVVGIDLGTTNSGVAYLDGKTPRMIHNGVGANITPSAIWEDPSGELKIGNIAYAKAGSALRFKRLMGEGERVRFGARELAPEECSSLILRQLVEDAEQTLRTRVESAVITVPANWKDGPRRATAAAGRLAGLRVERLINEPTAAAMAYGMNERADGKTIAVYDLGGGTFDITLLRVQQKVFDIITSNGDRMLGGTDFDEKIFRLVMQRLHDATGYDLPPKASRDAKFEQRIRDLEIKCEDAKKELSFTQESTVVLHFLDLHRGGPLVVEERLTRAEFERLVEDDVQKTLKYMESALRDAKLPREAVDDIVLVGGSSRIPLVRRRVAEFFGKEPLTSAVNPDEAVALGAAIQAGIIGQDEVTDDAFVALEIVNNTLGVETAQIINGNLVSGIFSPIIEKGEKVPTVGTGEYTTIADNQDTILVKCYEGGAMVTERNEFLPPEIRVTGLPPRPAGGVKINIQFRKSVDDLLDVEINIADTPIKVSHQIHMRSGLHNEEDFNRSKADMDSLWAGGRKGGSKERPDAADTEWRTSELAARYKALIERAEGLLAERSDLPSRRELARVVSELKQAIARNDSDKAEALDLALTDLIFEIQ